MEVMDEGEQLLRHSSIFFAIITTLTFFAQFKLFRIISKLSNWLTFQIVGMWFLMCFGFILGHYHVGLMIIVEVALAIFFVYLLFWNGDEIQKSRDEAAEKYRKKRKVSKKKYLKLNYENVSNFLSNRNFDAKELHKVSSYNVGSWYNALPTLTIEEENEMDEENGTLRKRKKKKSSNYFYFF